jgi:hypothetical protein
MKRVFIDAETFPFRIIFDFNFAEAGSSPNLNPSGTCNFSESRHFLCVTRLFWLASAFNPPISAFVGSPSCAVKEVSSHSLPTTFASVISVEDEAKVRLAAEASKRLETIFIFKYFIFVFPLLIFFVIKAELLGSSACI